MIQWLRNLCKRKPVQLCEDCENYAPLTSSRTVFENRFFAKCKAFLEKPSVNSVTLLTSGEYRSCFSVRSACIGPQCKKFKKALDTSEK